MFLLLSSYKKRNFNKPKWTKLQKRVQRARTKRLRACMLSGDIGSVTMLSRQTEAFNFITHPRPASILLLYPFLSSMGQDLMVIFKKKIIDKV